MPRGKADPVAWARAQGRSIGARCSLCLNAELGEFARAILSEWAAGRTTPGALSWPKVARAVRDNFGTRTVWESVRNHFRDHDRALFERVEQRRRAGG